MKIKFFLLLSLVAVMVRGQMFEPPVPEPVDYTEAPAVQWKFKTGGPIVSNPVIDHGIVYVGSLDSCLYALDIATGKLKWKLPTTGQIRSSVALTAHRAFLLSSDGFLYRMSKDSGKVDGFIQTMTGYIGDRQHDYADYYSSTPVIVDSTIYFGAGENIYAVGINDGYLRWTYNTGDLVHTRPAIGGGRLYAGSFDGNLYALDLRSGQLLWKFKSTGKYSYPKGEFTGHPLAVAGMVIAAARDNNLYAIDVRGGYCNWVRSFPSGWGLAATLNDTVVLVNTYDDRTVFAIDLMTGRDIWRTPAGFNMLGGCAVARKVGYFGTLSGKLNGIDLKTGKILWTVELDGYKENHLKWMQSNDSFRPDISRFIRTPMDMLKMYQDIGGIFGAPAIELDRLVVAGYDGSVYCLSAAKNQKTDGKEGSGKKTEKTGEKKSDEKKTEEKK
ncbi:MAG TPA: PQQ-binding-like beta-propeller repeat protein [Bacteroidales bacterium]|nr:PQQ-binding-like beta-propeller repeat protein [Bacteroidales bacterium]